MVKQLVKLVFEQAKNETPNVSKTGLSKHISKKIEENDNTKIFSYKTFTRYYDKYINDKEGVIDQPQVEIVEELCKYLGFKNYQEFVIQQKTMCNENVFVNNEYKTLDVELKPINESNELVDTVAAGRSFFSNKNFIKQVFFVSVLIFLFKSNWSQDETVLCSEHHYVERPITQNVAYEDFLMKKMKKKTMNTRFIISKE